MITKKIDIKKSRFRDAAWFDKLNSNIYPIIIGGVGGIGSWLALFLGRVLPTDLEIHIYDFDTVEEINMAGQIFGKQDIGLAKVEAIKRLVSDYTGNNNVISYQEKYDENSLRSPIMFSAFDNMQARKDMFNNWKQEAKKVDRSIFIDGRLLAEQLQVFYVTPDRIKEYESKYLFSDDEVEAENCSYKQTTHFAATIAAKMIQGFTNWFDENASLPFYYEEIGQLFLVNEITL